MASPQDLVGTSERHWLRVFAERAPELLSIVSNATQWPIIEFNAYGYGVD